MHRRPYSKILLALVLLMPLGSAAQNADPSTSSIEADSGTPQTSIAPPPDPVSVTGISSEEESIILPTSLPSEDVLENEIRPPKPSTVIHEPPDVTTPPYPATPNRDDANPGGQEQSSTTSRIGVAPPSDPEGEPALRPDPTETSRYSETSGVVASTALPEDLEKASSVGDTKPTPVVVAPQSTPGATGQPQASTAQEAGASSQAPRPSQAGPGPVPGQNTQGPPANSDVPAASAAPSDNNAASKTAAPSDSNAASKTANGGAVATGTGGASSGATPTDGLVPTDGAGPTDSSTATDGTAPTGGAAITGDNDEISAPAISSEPAQFSGPASRNAIKSDRGIFIGLICVVLALF